MLSLSTGSDIGILSNLEYDAALLDCARLWVLHLNFCFVTASGPYCINKEVNIGAGFGHKMLHFARQYWCFGFG
jgi:hypothetical protein